MEMTCKFIDREVTLTVSLDLFKLDLTKWLINI